MALFYSCRINAIHVNNYGIKNQSVTQGRTTLLDAVNVLLANIGEQPINSLETEQIDESKQAERTILEFHKEGQTKGWS